MPPEALTLKITVRLVLAEAMLIGVKLLVMNDICVLAGIVKVTVVPEAKSPPEATLAVMRLPFTS